MQIGKYILFTFFLAVAGCFPSIVCGQGDQYVVDRIHEENGFPHGRVSHIMEDHQGYLWFATGVGLLRYDGYQFTTFRHQIGDTTSLSHTFSRCVYQDRNNTIWVGTTYGLNRYDPADQTFQSFIPDPIEGKRSKFRNPVWAIHEDKAGQFWIGTNIGLYRFDRKTEQFEEVKSGKGESLNQSVRSFLEMENGDLWVGCYRGLAHIPSGDKTFDRYFIEQDKANTKRNQIISDIDLSPEGELIICSSGGRYFWNTQSQSITEKDLPEGLEKNGSSQYLVDQEGNEWIAYAGKGIFLRKTDGTTQLFENKALIQESLSANSAYHLYQDRFNNIWIGTTNGISRIRRPQKGFALHQNTERPLDKENRISRILVSQSGDTWMRSESGILRMTPNKPEPERIRFFPEKKKEPFLDAFLEMPDGSIYWAFRNIGIYKMLPGSLNLEMISLGDTLNTNQVYKMEIDLDHENHIWIGSVNGLCHVDLDTRKRSWHIPRTQLPSLPNNKLAIYSQGFDQVIWMYYTYNSSIGSLDKKTGKFDIYFPPSDKAAYLDGSVYDIQIGNDTAVWLATRYGLVRFDCQSKSFGILTQDDGFPENELTNVVQADEEHLWIAGYSSISRYNLKTKELIPFNIRQQIGRFYTKSKCLSADGTLYFGGRHGMYVINPTLIEKDSRPPEIVLSNFEVWNKTYPLDRPYDQIDRIVLNHQENDIAFEFAALHFIHPKGNVYQYQLDGYDKGWQDHGTDRKVNYTNLAPGDYRFRVRAANSDGIWSEQELSVPVIISPAVWQTNWFKALILLVGFSIVFALFRNWQHQQTLKREKRLAEQAAEYKTRFLANVSHEIRTPMNAIIGLSDLIQETPLQTNQRQFLQTIRRSSANLLKIINDLLDFSKLESGKFSFSKQAFDLRIVLRDVEEMLQLKAQEKNLDFTIHLADGVPPFLIGDALRLNQILLNLLGNAIKFTETGSVTLQINALEKSEDSIQLECKIIDTGIGIPEGKLKEIFEDFSQADSDTAAKYGGTGLGLSITKQLIEKQNGRLSIQSQVGKGSAFLFELPFGIAESIETEIIPKGKKRNFRPLRILVVEDNSFNQLLAKEFLNMHLPETKVEIAENGQVALDILENQNFDLILMDIKMPVMNGYEASQAIRALEHPKKASVPIVGLTAHIVPEQLRKCQEAGMNDCISKPFDKETLLDRIYKFTNHNHENQS